MRVLRTILMGLWSELRAFRVVQDVSLLIEVVVAVMSGDVHLWLGLVGILVGESLFSMERSELSTISAIRVPLWSVNGECQSRWWAFMSPVTMVLSNESRYAKVLRMSSSIVA